MKIGRNEPCNCGSNKKYKKCCLNAKWHGPVCDWNYIGMNRQEYIQVNEKERVEAKKTLGMLMGLAAGLNS